MYAGSMDRAGMEDTGCKTMGFPPAMKARPIEQIQLK